MRKLILLLCLLFASPALASEHWIPANALTETTVTKSGSTFSFANSWSKRAYIVDPAIHRGDSLHYTITIANYVSGQLTAYAQGIKMTCAGTSQSSPNGSGTGDTAGGQTAIADNFDNTQALSSLASQFVVGQGGVLATGIDVREGDTNGSFRFGMNVGKTVYLPDDPMVCPNSPGSSHLHQFFCNTGVNAYTTYHSLRTTGGTGCGDSRYPVNRSAYWTPTMMDGAGHIVPILKILIYYKTIPTNHAECSGAPDSTHVGYCVELPNGLKYLAGYDASTGLHGPTDNTNLEYGQLVFQCTSGFNTAKAGTGTYHSIDEVRAAGCGIGDFLFVAMTGPPCWDGVHLDSANHRDHVAYTGSQTTLTVAHDSTDNLGSWSRCPADHPYLIPTFSMQMNYRIDANFVAGHWHLSCDEQMGSSMPAGACLHMDYMEGWSPTIKARWQGSATTPGPNGGTGTGCINGRNNGNSGSLCDGYQINGMGGNPGAVNVVTTPSNLIPLPRVGRSRPLSGNGTYQGEIKAISDGEIGINAFGGFTGDVTVSFTDVTKVGKHAGVNGTTN